MATVKIDGYADTVARLDRLAADVRGPVVRHLQNDEARPLLLAMRARGRRLGTLATIATRSLEYRQTPNGGIVSAGGTSSSSLPAVLFAGTEYGGRKRVTRYARRSPKGNAHAVTRHTTMMFRPNIQRGYWYWPSVRSETRGIVGRVRDVVEKEVGNG